MDSPLRFWFDRPSNGAELATYVVEKGNPLVVLVK